MSRVSEEAPSRRPGEEAIGARKARLSPLAAVALGLLAVEGVTGAVLMWLYRPVPGLAAVDLIDLAEVHGLGFLRQLHRSASHVAVAAVALHLLAVGLAGRYRPPRAANWRIGLLLLLLLLSLVATGEHLGRGGLAPAPTVPSPTEPEGRSALLGAYSLHVLLLPLALGWLTRHHVRRARRDDAEGGPSA